MTTPTRNAKNPGFPGFFRVTEHFYEFRVEQAREAPAGIPAYAHAAKAMGRAPGAGKTRLLIDVGPDDFIDLRISLAKRPDRQPGAVDCDRRQ